MSMNQACAEVEAVIGRSRSLFGDASATEALGSATDIDRAVQTAAAALERTVSLSGHGIDAYQSVVDRSVGLLTTGAGSDRTLAAHIRAAAAVTQAGAVRLDHIAAQNQEISRAAAGAATPAAQRVILTALRSQLAQTAQVVQSTQQKAAELAGHIRALPYPEDTPQSPGHDDGSRPPNGIQAVGYGPKSESPFIPGVPTEPWQYNLDLTSAIYTDAVPSIDDVWNELHRCFNCSFPIGGAPKGFPKVGDKLPLEIGAAGQQLANFPVQVTQVQRTADEINIEFTTLPGHVDGTGSTIHFKFSQQGGQLHLQVNGRIVDGPGSEVGPIGAPERVGYTRVAVATWQPFIDRLTNNIKKHPTGSGVPA